MLEHRQLHLNTTILYEHTRYLRYYIYLFIIIIIIIITTVFIIITIFTIIIVIIIMIMNKLSNFLYNNLNIFTKD